MSGLNKLQKLALGLIIGLVWFDILCFTIMFLASVFDWTFLSNRFSTTFFAAFGVSLGALVALAILHMTVSLNLLSFSIHTIANSKVGMESISHESKKGDKLFKISLIWAVGGIIAMVLLMWYAQIRVDQHKLELSLNEIESIAKSSLADKAAELISANASMEELMTVRDAMYSSLQEKRGLSFIVPYTVANAEVFYEITPWFSLRDDKVKTIADGKDRVFVPYNDTEKKKFEELIKTQQPVYVQTKSSLRIFYPVLKDKKLIFILLYDTSREVSDDYLLKSSK